jgi:hypothetical protein
MGRIFDFIAILDKEGNKNDRHDGQSQKDWRRRISCGDGHGG